MAKQYLIKSFHIASDDKPRRIPTGMLGLHTHEALSLYVGGFKHDLVQHGEWLVINGVDMGLDIKLKDLEAACGYG